MIWTSTRTLTSLLTLSLLASAALAGPLATDPAAFLKSGDYPVVNFNNMTGGVTLNANVDFAVYTPGSFSTSTALGNPTDPSGGLRWVYAYEIFSLGSSPVSTLSVGLLPAALPANATHTAANLVGSVAPALSQLIGGTPPGSAKWTFIGSGIQSGNHSDILLFTSPYAPTFLQASVLGNPSTGKQENLPSPIPEPASLVLTLIGFGVYVTARSLRRQRS